jgi:hypothetical protein
MIGRNKGIQKALKAGLPLVLLLAGGSYVLSTFTATQFEQKDKNRRKMSQKKFDIEEEHRRLMDLLKIDEGFLSVRIPRPSEPASLSKAEERRKLRDEERKRMAKKA